MLEKLTLATLFLFYENAPCTRQKSSLNKIKVKTRRNLQTFQQRKVCGRCQGSFVWQQKLQNNLERGIANWDSSLCSVQKSGGQERLRVSQLGANCNTYLKRKVTLCNELSNCCFSRKKKNTFINAGDVAIAISTPKKGFRAHQRHL